MGNAVTIETSRPTREQLRSIDRAYGKLVRQETREQFEAAYRRSLAEMGN